MLDFSLSHHITQRSPLQRDQARIACLLIQVARPPLRLPSLPNCHCSLCSASSALLRDCLLPKGARPPAHSTPQNPHRPRTSMAAIRLRALVPVPSSSTRIHSTPSCLYASQPSPRHPGQRRCSGLPIRQCVWTCCQGWRGHMRSRHKPMALTEHSSARTRMRILDDRHSSPVRRSRSGWSIDWSAAQQDR